MAKRTPSPRKGDLVAMRDIVIPAGTVFRPLPTRRDYAAGPAALREAVVGVGRDAVGYMTFDTSSLPDAVGWLEEIKE